MYNPDTDLLFPTRVLPSLRLLRGDAWRVLVDEVSQQDQTSIKRVAFSLLMVRMGGCVSCNADSYRAMRGCTQCARLTVKRFKGSDPDLVEQYQQAEQEVKTHYGKNKLIR